MHRNAIRKYRNQEVYKRHQIQIVGLLIGLSIFGRKILVSDRSMFPSSYKFARNREDIKRQTIVTFLPSLRRLITCPLIT